MLMGIATELLLRDVVVASMLLVYSAFIIFILTKKLYSWFLSKGLEEKRAAYFNRKVVHIMIGGVVSAIIPFAFNYPILPAISAWVLGFYLLFRRTKGSLMYWFQVRENAYEVNFAFAWGAAVLILWEALGDPFMAMIPPMLVSFGDGITGIVRNLIIRKRAKHWIGNIAMAMLMVPIGYIYGGLVGATASLIASFVERYEFGIIDDNILIVLSSGLFIIAAKVL
ncbi:MAG TPA: dolichol kinase [Fervidicoccus fontis]|uniref:Dolichol kinase n=1 Tax=Fervidicoccus fontis TaxID=683846 RepID=A0A7C2YI02_9CREN|nr:dolichol kinase [Fervidicoccus fontis]